MGFEPVRGLPLLEVEAYEGAAVERWRKEGLPADKTVAEFLGLDVLETVPLDFWPIPRSERQVIEENADYVTARDELGIVTRSSKRMPGVLYAHLDHPIKTRDDWEEMKQRFDATDPSRYPSNWGNELIERYNCAEHPVGLVLHPFFFRLGYYTMGTRNFMLAFYDDPQLIHDMFSFWAEFCMAVMKELLDRVRLDYVAIAEDLAYKHSSHISPRMYQEFWMPYQPEVIRFLRSHGVPIVSLWSSGDLHPILPLALEAGFNATWPLESMAGMDAVMIRRQYGKSLALAGNIAIAALINGKESIRREVETKVVPLAAEGGFIPTVDDITPPEVPFENYVYYIALLREVSGEW